jgi:hypothetical protein
MLHYLTKYPPVVFSPEVVSILAAALDDAWSSVEVTNTLNLPGSSSEILREILAKHIIEMAHAGERDRKRLCEGAIARLSL